MDAENKEPTAETLLKLKPPGRPAAAVYSELPTTHATRTPLLPRVVPTRATN